MAEYFEIIGTMTSGHQFTTREKLTEGYDLLKSYRNIKDMEYIKITTDDNKTIFYDPNHITNVEFIGPLTEAELQARINKDN